MTAVTNKQSVAWGHDPVLLPFLRAADDVAADVALTALLAEHVEPRLREIVPYKLRSFASRSDETEERADVHNEILVQLLTQLTELRAKPRHNVIHNFRSYVAVTAYRACYDYLRRKYPQRYSLKHKLRYTLARSVGLACWQLDSSEEWLGGLAAWQGDAVVCSASRVQELRAQLSDFARRNLPRGSAVNISLPQLLQAFFQWAGQPLALDDLVGIVGDLLGIKDQFIVRGTNAEGALAQMPDQRASVVSELAARAYLKQLWQEIVQMTPRHCAALLLNLRDESGGCALDLLLGVASFQQIAAAMALTEAELAALWNHLPLEDAVIAERQQITRQQVINLRRSARERLARRLAQAGF